MIRLTEDEKRLYTMLIRQFPQFEEFLSRWQEAEVGHLLSAKDHHTLGVIQGRAQVLNELRQALKTLG